MPIGQGIFSARGMLYCQNIRHFSAHYATEPFCVTIFTIRHRLDILIAFIKYLLHNFFFISAVKRLTAINHIQNKVFVYLIYVCVLCIFIMCIYIKTHIVYILKMMKKLWFTNIFSKSCEPLCKPQIFHHSPFGAWSFSCMALASKKCRGKQGLLIHTPSVILQPHCFH